MKTPFILDMSQATINRTAMYAISMDVLEGLKDRIGHVQYFGHCFEGRKTPTEIPDMDGRHLGPLLSDPDGFSRIARKRKGALAKFPRLFLDPLYVLFDELRPTDHVMVLDLSTVTKPDWHSPAVARAYGHAFDKIRAAMPRILSISQNSADTLAVNYAFPCERMTVVPLYVPANKIATGGPVADICRRQPFVLFVGSLEVRKNLIGAIKSFERSGLGAKGYSLVIVGGRGHMAEDIQAYAASVPMVEFAGFLSDEELQQLYANASAFLYPSYLEGFGVPLLEAMAYGVPAVASRTGACPEVGGPLVRYFDPDDHQGFADELVRLVGLDAKQKQRFREQADSWIQKRYTLEKFLSTVDQAVS